MSYRKYETLETYVAILKIVAWILLVASIVSALYAFGLRDSGSVALGVYVLVLGGLGTIGLLAYAQLITVAIDIESNTQKSATDTSELLKLLTRVHEVKPINDPKTSKDDDRKIVKHTIGGHSLSPIQQALIELENEENAKKT